MNTDLLNKEANSAQPNTESSGNQAEQNLKSLLDELNRKFKTHFLSNYNLFILAIQFLISLNISR